MMALSPRRKATADASMAATRLHLRLNTPFDRPVDVVTLAQRLGLWVAAQPLDSLYGFYLRESTGSGLVLNSKHPETLQRFTCGHEIGHHVLGHDSLTDARESVTSFHGPHLDVTEMAAQTFAASLLMPLPLVNAVLRAFVHDRPLFASDAYIVSRELGVSYTAAVAQLQQLGKLTFDQAQFLSRHRPLKIKSGLRGGSERVADARADLWLLGEEQNGAHLQCRLGDEIHLRLPEDLSRGRQWQLTDDAASSGQMTPSDADPTSAGLSWNGGDVLQLLEAAPAARPTSGFDVIVDEHVAADTSGYDAPSTEIVGEDAATWPDLPNAGERHFILLAREAGRRLLQALLCEPWLIDPEPAATFSVTLDVAPTRRLEGVGVAQPQREAHVRRLAAA